MANRIRGNVIIIDSAAGNNGIIQSGTGNMSILSVNAFAFWSSDTLGKCVFTLDVTAGAVADNVVVFQSLANGTGGNTERGQTQWYSFASPQKFQNLKVPTLTAGTAWIYLA